MFGEEKNLKDSQKDSIKDKDTSSAFAPYQAVGSSLLSYTKTHKLIIALYMVTDIIDKDEPLKNKLRTLGIEILSDISTMSKVPFDNGKINQILPFLDIAYAINIISEMNCSILKKEFLKLNKSIEESNNKIKTINGQINLSEFFNSPLEEYSDLGRRDVDIHPVSQASHPRRGEVNPIGHYSNGHQYSTRIGVQKGSTLMKALSDRTRLMSNNNFTSINKNNSVQYKKAEEFRSSFNMLKEQRRNDIINIIKIIGVNATIKNIKDKAQASKGKFNSFVSCSEKTLQRELISMVKDGVLNKVGEKRWSRYFLK